MAKVDIRHAYRLCPVREEDFPLLGFSWLDMFFFDLRLPFGSRSSAFLFNSFADALCWNLTAYFGIMFVIHYSDDFFIITRDQPSCQLAMAAIAAIFVSLGVPVAVEKLVGPAQSIPYLGIEIDAENMTIRLPESKLTDIKAVLSSWLSKKKCTKKELLSLTGKLSFAAKVVKPGRLFLRRLSDLSSSVSSIHHHIHINSEARRDISWWHSFVSTWNGISVIQEPPVSSSDIALSTDACLRIGFGGVFGKHWFHGTWPEHFDVLEIAPKEVFAISVAIVTWKTELASKQIILYTDNDASAQVWSSGVARDANMLRFLRPLFFHCASANINLLVKHIPGIYNTLPDLLSRSQVERFRSSFPQADALPTPIPAVVWTFQRSNRDITHPWQLPRQQLRHTAPLSDRIKHSAAKTAYLFSR